MNAAHAQAEAIRNTARSANEVGTGDGNTVTKTSTSGGSGSSSSGSSSSNSSDSSYSKPSSTVKTTVLTVIEQEAVLWIAGVVPVKDGYEIIGYYHGDTGMTHIETVGASYAETAAVGGSGETSYNVGNYVQLRQWITDRTKNLPYLSADLRWDEGTKTAYLTVSNDYGASATFGFKIGMNGNYIKDGRIYVSESQLWQAFGAIIDPPLDYHPVRDSIIEGIAVGVMIKLGPKVVEAVGQAGKAITGYVTSLMAGGAPTLEKGINFADKAMQHMNEPGRFVPIQTLIDAIRYGTANPDPRGSQAVMYTIEMIKNGKAYELEVLYDQASNTIYHFLYK
jgi:hypothetical protein